MIFKKNWDYGSYTLDLDGDGRLEVIQTYNAHRYDDSWNATELWNLIDMGVSEAVYSIPHVANFDTDSDPEVFFTTDGGYILLEHDGTPVFGVPNPYKPPEFSSCTSTRWTGFMWPAAIVDFDTDDQAEVAVHAWSWQSSAWIEELFLPRSSLTIGEYPVVADVDNDGSAEILVVSFDGEPRCRCSAMRTTAGSSFPSRSNRHFYYRPTWHQPPFPRNEE